MSGLLGLGLGLAACSDGGIDDGANGASEVSSAADASATPATTGEVVISTTTASTTTSISEATAGGESESDVAVPVVSAADEQESSEPTESSTTEQPTSQPDTSETSTTTPSSTEPPSASSTTEAPTTSTQTPPAERLNGFSWPMQGNLGLGFEYVVHPVYGTKKLHAGQDINAPIGTPVVAAKPGTVVTAIEGTGGYGNYVVIDHGDGVHTLYAHQNVLLVTEGMVVEAGQQIGELGQSGAATGPVLFFMVRVDDEPIDPLTVLPEHDGA